jgi:hypothetical protein
MAQQTRGYLRGAGLAAEELGDGAVELLGIVAFVEDDLPGRVLQHAALEVLEPPGDLGMVVRLVVGFFTRRLWRGRGDCGVADETGRDDLRRCAPGVLGVERPWGLRFQDEGPGRARPRAGQHDQRAGRDIARAMHAHQVVARRQRAERAPARLVGHAGHDAAAHRRHDGAVERPPRLVAHEADDRAAGLPGARGGAVTG